MSNSVNSSHHSSIAGGEVSKNVNRTDDDDDMADKKKGGSSSESAISSFKLILLVLMVLQNSSTVLVGRYTRTSVTKSELYVVNHLILVTELGKVSLDESLRCCCCFVRHREYFCSHQLTNLPCIYSMTASPFLRFGILWYQWPIVAILS